MDKLQWIKDLVLAEQKMEESGMVDISAGFDPEGSVQEQSVEFLRELKVAFIEAAASFNQLKGSNLGNIKIYGISKTAADFMLFRNGFKLIFSLTQPGAIAVRFHHIASTFVPGAASQETKSSEDDFLKARWGAFGELNWTFKDQKINLDYLVRYYMSRFVRESAK
jgi:hypothetical protein